MEARWTLVALLAGAAAVAVFRTEVVAQEAAKPQDSAAAGGPKTKIEAFEARSGSVIITGYQTIGRVEGSLSTSVEIECKEFIDAGSGKRERGLTVTVRREESRIRVARDSTSYVDYDEIDSLVAGIDYITKVDRSCTKLSSFQANYRTRGDLTVSSYSSGDGKIEAGVKCGNIGGTLAFLTLGELAEFRRLVVHAKSTLDEAK